MKTTFVVFCLLTINIISAQKVCNDLYNKKFTKQQLDQDVDFMKEKILNAHVSPFTEISKEEFEKKYTYIKNSLKDGMDCPQKVRHFLGAFYLWEYQNIVYHLS